MLSPVPATRTNPWAFGTAALINGGILALLLSLGLRTITSAPPSQPHRSAFSIETLPIFSLPNLRGGQGGGVHDPVEATRGRLPQIEKTPLAPPQIPVLENPKLRIDPAMTAPPNAKLPDDQSLSVIGLPHSSNLTVISGGPGSHGGIGPGDNGGVGPGHGIGFGPGDDNTIYIPGGAITEPVPIVTPEAEFSEEARRNKFQGICMIAVIIDAHGNPQSPRVIRALGMGLDEKALAAVLKYRFKPATKNGKPVASRITVAVNFRLF